MVYGRLPIVATEVMDSQMTIHLTEEYVIKRFLGGGGALLGFLEENFTLGMKISSTAWCKCKYFFKRILKSHSGSVDYIGKQKINIEVVENVLLCEFSFEC